MEPNLWDRFTHFVKNSLQERFSAAFKGCCLGLIGSLNVFWNGSLAPSVVIYIFKGIGTLLLTAGTTLTTCYISYKFDKWKERQPSDKKSKKNKKAA